MLYACPSCMQVHRAPIFRTINFRNGLPIDLRSHSSDLKVCQFCSKQQSLKSYKYLGRIKSQQRKKIGKICQILLKILGSCVEPELSPVYLYPPLSDIPFNPKTFYPNFLGNVSVEYLPLWLHRLSEHHADLERKKQIYD